MHKMEPRRKAKKNTCTSRPTQRRAFSRVGWICGRKRKVENAGRICNKYVRLVLRHWFKNCGSAVCTNIDVYFMSAGRIWKRGPTYRIYGSGRGCVLRNRVGLSAYRPSSDLGQSRAFTSSWFTDRLYTNFNL